MKTKISNETLFYLLWQAKVKTQEDIKVYGLNYDKEFLIEVENLLNEISIGNTYEYYIVSENVADNLNI